MMIGAIITAAGVSSRMGEFKPLLKIGSMTIIEKMIYTLKESGVDEIVVVTGNQSERLQSAIHIPNVILIKNDDYLHNHMLDSIQLGLRSFQHQCDKILISPVDMPLFKKESIETLIASHHDLTYISYQGKKGHPIMVSHNVVSRILDFHGELGLKGILIQIEDKIIIPVNDPGIIHDADTPQNYQKLLQIYNQQDYRPYIELKILKDNEIMNQHIAQILYLIDSTHSLLETSHILQLSKNQIIELIQSLEKQLGYALVLYQQDEIYLSHQAEHFLKQYRLFEKHLNEIAQELYDQFMK